MGNRLVKNYLLDVRNVGNTIGIISLHDDLSLNKLHKI